MTIKKLLTSDVDSDVINPVIEAFLQTQTSLKEDYSIEELEKFFNEQYSRGNQSNKDWLAIWNFNKVITEFRGVSS